jgi:ComF family protein
VWITTTHEGAVRELLKLYKFEHQRPVAGTLAELMAQTFRKYGQVRDYLVVPIPTATGRVRERGFDHANLLAAKVAQQLAMDYQPVLGRLGQTRQVGAKRSDRLVQVRDNFWLKRPKLIDGRSIILVDDVITTGATVYAASKLLRLAGAKRVDALIFAKQL